MIKTFIRFLAWLEERLLPLELSLARFHLPQPVEKPTVSSVSALLLQEISYDCEAEMRKAKTMLSCLNTEQKQFFDEIMSNLSSEKGGLFCVDAPGGTGKTYLLNCILSAVRSDSHIAIATALSAVASKLLAGGTTLHSRLKVPIQVRKDSVCSFTNAVAKLMTKAKLLIIDEVSMGHRHCYEALDRYICI